MATTKTIDATNQTVTIPAMADKPDQSKNSDGISKLVDGCNALSNHIAKLDAVNFANTRTDIKAELTDVNDYTFLNSGYLVICAKSSGYVRLSMNNTLVTHDIPANSWNSLFVFKEMKAHITSATAGNVEYAFINPVP